jgi:hypothetical protein
MLTCYLINAKSARTKWAKSRIKIESVINRHLSHNLYKIPIITVKILIHRHLRLCGGSSLPRVYCWVVRNLSPASRQTGSN